MKNIAITNIAMRDVQTAIFIHIGNRARKKNPGDSIRPPGQLKNVMISHVTAKSHSKITNSISGQPGFPVENVKLNNIQINSMGKGTLQEANLPVAEKPISYPEQHMFGYSLPAYGFYLRHVKNISFHHVDFQLRNPDSRPGYAMEDVSVIFINNTNGTTFQVKAEPKKIIYTPANYTTAEK